MRLAPTVASGSSLFRLNTSPVAMARMNPGLNSSEF
jgi:hypothetical protein